MADSIISNFTALAQAPATGDLLAVVDVSDTSQAASGTTKKITAQDFLSGKWFPDPHTFVLGGTVSTGTSKTNLVIVPYDGTIVKAWIKAKTAPTGADLICDINLNGASIWDSTQANRIKLVATNTSGSQTSFDTTAVSAGDTLTIDVDQVGSTVAGADVTVQLIIHVQRS